LKVSRKGSKLLTSQKGVGGGGFTRTEKNMRPEGPQKEQTRDKEKKKKKL